MSTLSPNDAEKITAANQLILASTAQKRKLQQQTREYAARSNRIASAYRSKIFDKALQLAGVDQEEIRKRQADNDQADQKFIASIQPILNESARATNERNVRMIPKLKHRYPWPLPGQPHPAPIFEFLTTASEIRYEPSDQYLPNFHSSIGPSGNLAQFSLGPYSDYAFNILFSFPWTPPRSGTLTLGSVVAPNGSAWWGAKHGCIETWVEAECQASLWAFDPGSGTTENPLYEQFFLNEYRNWYPGCSSDIVTQLLDQPVFMEPPTGFLVEAGSTIMITVVVFVGFAGSEITGEIDFVNNGKSINVPSVWLRLV